MIPDCTGTYSPAKGKKNMSGSVFDTAPGFDQPIAVLKHCHNKIRRQIATLQKLLAHLPEHGADTEAKQAAGAVRSYFNQAAQIHHADEEVDLLPMLRKTASGADSELLNQLAPQLANEHQIMEKLWLALDSQLAAIAAGSSTYLSSEEVKGFIDIYNTHMSTEETDIAPMASRLFSSAQLAAMGASMQQRRAIAPSSASSSAPAAPAIVNGQASVAHLRTDFKRASLSEADVLADPVAQFGRWFDEAQTAKVLEADATCLSTVSASGRPSSRILLLKDFDHRGFSWHTSYDSRKGEELAHNPFGSLLFFWSDLERQIRIEGRVEKMSEAENELNFDAQPLASRLHAIASHQSMPLTDRATLERRYAEIEASAGDKPARPADWGGYRLVPDRMEFWQGRGARFHDRIIYTLLHDGSWQRSRLQP
jgi:pyridoxamine 5'-phosphate oxidase